MGMGPRHSRGRRRGGQGWGEGGVGRPTSGPSGGLVSTGDVAVVPDSIDVCEGLVAAAEGHGEQNWKRKWVVLIYECPCHLGCYVAEITYILVSNVQEHGSYRLCCVAHAVSRVVLLLSPQRTG